MPIFLQDIDTSEDAMIALDATEVREDSKLLLNNVGVQVSSHLEELTGADLMISPLDMPISNETLIRKHIRGGALLVQRKHRMDLVSSMGTRLKSSQARMHRIGARHSQCVLLFIGVLTCNSDGMAMIDGQEAGRPYWAVNNALHNWNYYGGVVETLSRASLIPDWLDQRQRKVKEMVSRPEKEFFPVQAEVREADPTDPLQELKPVQDWRKTIVTLENVGPKRANDLRATMLKAGVSDTLLTALAWITTPEYIKQVPGFGPAIIRKAQAYLGLEEGFVLGVMEEPNGKKR